MPRLGLGAPKPYVPRWWSIRWKQNLPLGELRIQDQATGTPFVATNLAVTGTLNPQGAQQVAGEVVIKADKVTVDQQSGSGSLKLVLRNLDGVTMERDRKSVV